MTTDRRAPLVGLVLIAALAAIGAVVLQLVAADWQFKANTFYSSNANVQLTQEEYEAIDRMQYGAYQLNQFSEPLLIGAVAAVLALLAVLAFRWERQRQLAVATLATATAAS